MKTLIEKAAILHEALPYIRKFHGQTFVIKYGGHAMIDEELRRSFARDIVLMQYVGLHPVVVHGGGPQVDERLKEMGVVSERIDGLRVTDERTMDVVEMVIGGALNQEIVSLICGHGGRAVGLSGKDDRFLLAERVTKMKTKSGKEVDPGRVGRITKVNPEIVLKLMQSGFIPVVAPIASDSDGESLNVNADTVAGALAAALHARKLVLMTDTEGVKDAAGKVRSSLTAEEISALRSDGVIAGGMIPKVECALEAIAGGVKKAHIIDGRTQHAVLLELFTDQGIGTEIGERA
jgi:acetylglutamate kinase